MASRSSGWMGFGVGVALVGTFAVDVLVPLRALVPALYVALVVLPHRRSADVIFTIAAVATALTVLAAWCSPLNRGGHVWVDRSLFVGLLWCIALVRAKEVRGGAETAEALARAERLTTALLANAPDAILACAADGRVIRVNQSAIDLFGYSEAEFGAMNVDALVPAASRACHRAHRADFTTAPSVRPMGVGRAVHGVCKDGRSVELDVRLRPLVGGPAAVLVSARDVGVERLVQRRLQGVARMEALGRFTASVVHDFNNVLTIVYSHFAFVRHTVAAGDDVLPELTEMEAALDRARDLTQRLLSFSKGERAQLGPVDVSRAVREAAHMVQPLLGAGVRVVVDAPPSPWWARVDRAQLDHAVLNLLLNARDALPGGGLVRLRSANVHLEAADAGARGLLEGDYVCVSVHDSGLGVPSAILARMFEPFFSTKGAAGGTGLGLYSVREAVRAAGGGVEVRSAVGEGTCFDLWLPRCEAPV